MCSKIQNCPRLQLFCNITIRTLMVLILGFLFYLSIFSSSMFNAYIGDETTIYLTDQPFLHLSSIFLIFLFGYLLFLHPQTAKRIFAVMQNFHFHLMIHILVTILMLIAIFVCRYQPVSDQFNCLYSAAYLLEGNYFSWDTAGYLYIYPSLNGLTLLCVPFVALFGAEGGAVAFQVFNLIMLLIASYSLYRFCKSVGFNSPVVSLLFILYLPMTFYCFFVYGNTVSLSLSILSLWKIADFLKEKHIKDAVLSAATLAAACLLKETAIIPLIAILIILAASAVIQKKPKLLLLLPVYLIFLYCGSLAINLTIEGITHEEVSPGLKYYGRLTMGISEGERADGWYNSYTINLLKDCEYDLELYATESENAFWQHARDFWSNPSYFLPFLARKTASQWNNPTFQSLWIQQQMLRRNPPYGGFEARPLEFLCLDGSPTNMIFYFIFNLLQSIILFGSLCFFFFDAKKASLTSLLPAVTFIGGFLFLFFWEAKAQYTILFFVLLFPYSVSGFPAFLKRLVSLKGSKYWYRKKEVIFLILLLGSVLLFSITDTAPINDTIKLGRADQTAFYHYYLQQNTTMK